MLARWRMLSLGNWDQCTYVRVGHEGGCTLHLWVEG